VKCLVVCCLCLFLSTDLWGIDSRFLLKPEELPAASPPRPGIPNPSPDGAGSVSHPRTPPRKITRTSSRVQTTSTPSPVTPRKKRVIHRDALRAEHDLRLNGGKVSRPVDNVTPLLEVWPRIAGPGSGVRRDSLSFSRDDFSLRFDPSRYPVLETAEGRKILFDTAGTIPPLIQSLVTSVDPTVRIVAEDPSDRARFLSALLSAGGFYSVEENFRFTSGDDPLITVRADFKVERRQDSLMNQELVLVNHNQSLAPYSPALKSFLASRGFTVVEPYAREGERRSPPQGEQGTLRILSKGGRASIADGILDTIGIPYVRDARLDLFTASRDGVDLSVRTDRSFTVDGTPCVIGFFNGDPVTYTLMRLLETRGYRVVMLEEKDSVRDASQKMLRTFRLPGRFGFQDVAVRPDAPFSLRVTGLHLSDGRGKSLIVTDRTIGPEILRIVEEAGYRVIEQVE